MIAVENLMIQRGNLSLGPVSFQLERGSWVVLTGPSGCGKTSLIEAIAGLLPVIAGRVLFAGTDCTSLAPAQRGVGYMPQESALFRHCDVRANIGFGCATWGRPQRQQRIHELAQRCGVSDLLDRRVQTLSGGQASRVALARALAPRPKVLLLDEPFVALDATSRSSLLDCLAEVVGEVSVLQVSHDPRAVCAYGASELAWGQICGAHS